MKYKSLGIHFIGVSLVVNMLCCVTVFAYKSNGRIILGATAITERYVNDNFGSTSNDVLVASSRYFYQISDYGEDKWEYTADFRDKYDFFGKLNREQLQLQPENKFQTRQLSARWVNPNGSWGAQIGRFQVFEAGSIFVDGVSSEYKFNSEFKAGLMGGLNPKAPENSYLEYNAKASQGGVFITYQGKDKNWSDNKYTTLAFVNQTYNSQTERSFLFNNTVYQWEEDSRIINTAYYDFVPSAKLETLSFLYQQKLTQSLKSDIGILSLDTLAYRRNQDLLEALPLSAYNEARAKLDWEINSDDNTAIQILSGKRQIDNLTKDEVTLGYDLNNRFSKSFDFKTLIGYRHNFTSRDVFAKLGIGYYSQNWEIYFDNQVEQKKYEDGFNSNAFMTDVGITSYFSKQLYVSLSADRAADEKVTIVSTMLRLGYRFGNQEVPPVRDGAPPRGGL